MNKCDKAEQALLKDPAHRRIVIVSAMVTVSSRVLDLHLVTVFLKVLRKAANARYINDKMTT